MRRQGFTLVELMLVVAILGILGALAMPVYTEHTLKAKESAVRSNLNVMRAQIELYKLQHKTAAPGYVNGAGADAATLVLQFEGTTTEAGQTSPNKLPAAPFLYGPYLKRIPENPYNKLSTIAYVAVAADFAAAADGTSSGWLYKRETGDIRLNWNGTDTAGANLYEY